MGAIGDYIHSSAYGYDIYGTNYWGTEPQSDSEKISVFITQFQKAHAEVQKDSTFMSIEEKERLQERLSLFSKNPEETEYGTELKKMWKILVSELEHQFRAAEKDIDKLTHDVIQGHRVNAKKIGIKKEQRQMLTSTLLKRVNALNQSISQLSFSETTMEKIKMNMDFIQTGIRELQALADQASLSTGYQQLVQEGKVLSKKIDLNSKNKLIVAAINETINFINGSANMQKGMLEQAIVALAPLVGANKTIQELQNTVKAAFKQNESQVVFEKRNFSEEIQNNLNEILSGYKQEGQSYLSARVSSDKVDVTINWQGKSLPISVKNVNLDPKGNTSPYVNLVSQASLLAMLQSIGTDYTNHYLNVMSVHRSGTFTAAGHYEGKAETRSHYFQIARQSIRLSLLSAAFEGYKSKAQGGLAKVFVINDNQTGRVKVYNIGQLILRLVAFNSYLIPDFVHIKGNGTEIENIQFNNTFVPGPYSKTAAYQIITSLLSEVHKYKITVAIRKTVAFTEFY